MARNVKISDETERLRKAIFAEGSSDEISDEEASKQKMISNTNKPIVKSSIQKKKGKIGGYDSLMLENTNPVKLIKRNVRKTKNKPSTNTYPVSIPITKVSNSKMEEI